MLDDAGLFGHRITVRRPSIYEDAFKALNHLGHALRGRIQVRLTALPFHPLPFTSIGFGSLALACVGFPLLPPLLSPSPPLVPPSLKTLKKKTPLPFCR